MPMQFPQIVGEAEWRAAHDALLEKEKAATRDRDALAAERRRQPMTPFDGTYEFDGPDGRVDLPGLFAGRRQLIVYHFWFPPGGPPCGGCSMFTDQISELAHLRARDTELVLVSPAPQDEIAPFKARMGWDVPWYSVVGTAFQEKCGTTEYFALQVFLRDAAAGVPHLRDALARRRGARLRLDLPRPDAARPPGGVGGHAARPAAGPEVPVVALPRRVRRRRGGMTLAHIGGVPVEEALAAVPAAGAALVAWRATIAVKITAWTTKGATTRGD